VPNIWHTKWTLQDLNGKDVMRVELNGFVKVSGTVIIDQASLTNPGLALLALLGWYVIMLVLSDDASSTAAIVPVI
jgi:hypothetical protein